jgi:mannose-6-phosphate isomerase-like protein (cupin superfamily)
MERIDLAAALATIDQTWSPRTVARVNDVDVKLVKLDGDFAWHHHEHEDELFLVVRGHLTMHFRDRDVELDQGQLVVVPRGVEHRPQADGECHVLLVEPRSTRRLGNLEGDEPPRR